MIIKQAGKLEENWKCPAIKISVTDVRILRYTFCSSTIDLDLQACKIIFNNCCFVDIIARTIYGKQIEVTGLVHCFNCNA